MSDVTFSREPLVNILESGLEALLRAHWQEVAHDKTVISLDPDWAGYKEDEAAGRFIAFAARRDGELIGYNAFFTVHPRHYRGTLMAINDVIYLKPSERGAEGLALIVQAERALVALGVVKAFYHVKTDAILGQFGDSLTALEDIQDVEQRIGAVLPDATFAHDRTLGSVLRALGYNHLENHFGKLLAGAA